MNVLGRARVSVQTLDGMRWWTWLSVGGLVSAGVLALIGGFPLDTPMPTHEFGWVEPSCGLTRGSAAIARGDLELAWRYNPLSFLVMALGVAGIIRVCVGLATGRWLQVSVRPGVAGWILVALALVGFALYQQGNAEFIIHARA